MTFLTVFGFLAQLQAGAAAVPNPQIAEDLFTTGARPILARHCFKCHGPDEKARKAKLRLDNRDAALRPGRSGVSAIVPGKPDDSEVIRRVFSTDEQEMMPPPHAKNPLSAESKEVLRRWIAGGAPYTPHWAFVPPMERPLPFVRAVNWPRNPIDRFILARLEAEGLAPSPEADRYTLARRLYLDLIGLPPSLAEAESFVQDQRADAYDRLVDRLLASPHYGERWARKWLDLARYADTNGYEKDRPRSIWPYRDWVIRSLNADMPFDQFTILQLAGDMAPQAGQSGLVATGFHRNTMLNEEGGIDPLEFRFHAMTDRVATTGTAWLGLTLGCAQCHSHKYDPVSHREYYQFMAFLNNADEPEVEVEEPDRLNRRKQLQNEIERMTADLPNRFPGGEQAREKSLQKWITKESAVSNRWTLLRPTRATANLPLLTILDDSSVLASGDQSKSDTYDLSFSTALRGITAIRLEVLPDHRLPRGGPGRVYYEGPFGDFHLSEFLVTAGQHPVKIARATHSMANGNNTAALAIDGDQQSGWSLGGAQPKPHTAVFVLAQPLLDAGDLRVRLLFERYYSAGLGRFRIWATTDPKPSAARDMPTDVEAILSAPGQRTPQQITRLVEQFVQVAPELAAERAKIEQLRKQLPSLPTTLVMKERPAHNPRPTHVHHRGEFLQPREVVEPAIFSFLPQLPPNAQRDRLGLARWLVSGENPLTGRVIMNRHWAAFFGQGISRTTHDVGFQGELPSHPELLDWLALEFVRRGWSVKAMHRLIVSTATYRQSSQVSAGLLKKDPGNRLLARGPRVRLEAEQVRDAVLCYSGLFSARIGGPSVFPPQPAAVTTEGTYGGLAWKVSEGPDRYRRGLYTYSKRTAPFAMFNTFDGPSGEVCIARREASNTPLQALTLLNDPAFTEASQVIGTRLAAAPGTTEERLRILFRQCVTRPPTKEEVQMLMAFMEGQRQRLHKNELNAALIAGPGPGDVRERAAWTAVARALFNLDEFITRG